MHVGKTNCHNSTVIRVDCKLMSKEVHTKDIYCKFDSKALLSTVAPHGVVPFLKYATGCSVCVRVRVCKWCTCELRKLTHIRSACEIHNIMY